VDVFHGPGARFERIADLPFLPVSLFKTHDLLSIPRDAVFKTLHSSGTTGQSVSKVYLDKTTAQLQTAGLAAVMSRFLGPARLPMLLIDTSSLIRDPAAFSARGAGVLGMSNFGRKHLYLLTEEMRLKTDELRAWLEEFGRQPFLMLGLRSWCGITFRKSATGLIPTAFWCIAADGKLGEMAVSNDLFKAGFESAMLRRIHNFYGMVEQVGGVFVEGEDGLLRTPSFCEVIIRNPEDWSVMPDGETGVIQVLSSIPTSYPGHSILTEDLGSVVGCDLNGYGGRAFRVEGRVPRAELRGCSDTHAAQAIP
jgi:hypothetical protein